MVFPAFAYYKSTKVILAFVTCSIEFLLMVMVASIILTIFNVKATRKQKALFAFLSGTLLQSGWSYFVYFMHGAISFTALQYTLVTTPNPIAALIYCWLAIKIFHLSPIRSIKTMSYVYLFWSLIKNMIKVIGSFCFVQTHGHWNYLLDIIQQGTALVFFFSVYCIIMYLLKNKKIDLAVADYRFFNQKQELFSYFCKASFVYIVSALFPILMDYSRISSVLAFTINLLFFVIIACSDTISYYRQVVENNNVHISTLFNGMEEFRGLKHDFTNILQTYTGYITLGEIEPLRKYHNTLVQATMHASSSMELGRKAQENPALISLLTSKLDYAKRLNVTLHHSLQCNLSTFYIDNMDLCRILACLLDNAIESAAVSTEKQIHFSAEDKGGNSKLIIITNSIEKPIDVNNMMQHGATNKSGHSGIGLTTVRNTINKYGNCTFQMKCFNWELSVYIEFQHS